MPSTFVKLYGSILDSSVWDEDHGTVRVWIAMLAMADAEGFVRASHSGLRRRANVSDGELFNALEILEGPDIDDSSGVGEGERIIRREGGWHVVNHRSYRDLRTPKQVGDAERQARKRERDRSHPSHDTTGGVTESRAVAPDTDTEAEEETEAESRAGAPPRVATAVPPNITNDEYLRATLPSGDLCTDCYRGSCPVHAPDIDPKAARIVEVLSTHARAAQLGLATPEYATELLGSLGSLALGVSADELETSLREALADVPAGATEAFVRKLLRSYVRQVARKPHGERQHERDAPKPRKRRPRPTEPEPLGDLMSPAEIAKLAGKAAGAAKGGV